MSNSCGVVDQIWPWTQGGAGITQLLEKSASRRLEALAVLRRQLGAPVPQALRYGQVGPSCLEPRVGCRWGLMKAQHCLRVRHAEKGTQRHTLGCSAANQ